MDLDEVVPAHLDIDRAGMFASRGDIVTGNVVAQLQLGGALDSFSVTSAFWIAAPAGVMTSLP
jgi:hypothetical protein